MDHVFLCVDQGFEENPSSVTFCGSSVDHFRLKTSSVTFLEIKCGSSVDHFRLKPSSVTFLEIKCGSSVDHFFAQNRVLLLFCRSSVDHDTRVDNFCPILNSIIEF